MAARQFIGVAFLKTAIDAEYTSRVYHHDAVTAGCSPKLSTLTTTSVPSGKPAIEGSPLRRTLAGCTINVKNARRCFRLGLCSAPPVNTRTGRDCLATHTAPLIADSYLQHTPRLRHFKHLLDIAGTGHHTGNLSPSSVSDILRIIVHVA